LAAIIKENAMETPDIININENIVEINGIEYVRKDSIREAGNICR